MTAQILRLRAPIVRCWMIAEAADGLWAGVLHSKLHGEEARTEPGAYFAVTETVRLCSTHRGAPIFLRPVRKADRTAP